MTAQANPFRAGTSSGFEGMAITPDGRSLLPLLEKPLAGDPAGRLQANVYSIAKRAYTGERRFYQVADLLHIQDPGGVSVGEPGDFGIGAEFAFPFQTVESIALLDPHRVAILNDNNFPNSVGRHVGSGAPDDEELIALRLPEPVK